MNSKKIKIIISILMMILIIHNSVIYATSIDTNISIGTTPAIRDGVRPTGRILYIFQVVGSVSSVLALAIMGIKYMFSSVEGKADLKGILNYYVIGAILVFATSNMLSVVYNVVSKLSF